MIVGNGDIASVLHDKEDWTYFASGVSNSRENRPEAFQREKDLLLDQEREKHLVYFGSLAVFYSETPYTEHKLEMEKLIKEEFDRYSIMRIGNITWGTNPNTIINYFRQRIERGEPYEVRDEFRYIIDKDEFLYWVDLLPEWSLETAITGKRMTIQEIIDEYCYVGLHIK